VALVTGGGRGIGREAALLLSAAGARVMIVSRSATELAAVGLGSRIKPDKKGSKPPTRRAHDVPEPLAKARMSHGLCVKCGVVPYTPGREGHNSNTCKAVADKVRWPQGMSEQDKQVFQ